MLLTAIFVFAVFMLAAERHKGTVSLPFSTRWLMASNQRFQFIAPIGIGLALFVVELAGALFTGCSLNPARSFGTAVATHHFPGYHWIYWIAPLLGSVLAAALYKLVKSLETEIGIGTNGPAAFGHRRGLSGASTMRGGTGLAALNTGHTLGTVKEDDLERGQALPQEPMASADQPNARYVGDHDRLAELCAEDDVQLSGMTAVSDSNVEDTDTSNDRQSPRQSMTGRGRAL